MAFKSTEFKKTTRKSGEDRVLYPYQIRDDRYTSALGYAIAYYERMVGKRRAAFEAAGETSPCAWMDALRRPRSSGDRHLLMSGIA